MREATTISTLNNPSSDETAQQPLAENAEGAGDAALDQDVQTRLATIIALLEDEKAFDLVSIDLRGKSSFADFMVIASGRSSRHVGAISEKLLDKLKEMEGPRPRAEGVDNKDWALIDASDIVVHVFRPEVRDFYALEKMWAPATPAEPDASPQTPKEA